MHASPGKEKMEQTGGGVMGTGGQEPCKKDGGEAEAVSAPKPAAAAASLPHHRRSKRSLPHVPLLSCTYVVQVLLLLTLSYFLFLFLFQCFFFW